MTAGAVTGLQMCCARIVRFRSLWGFSHCVSRDAVSIPPLALEKKGHVMTTLDLLSARTLQPLHSVVIRIFDRPCPRSKLVGNVTVQKTCIGVGWNARRGVVKLSGPEIGVPKSELGLFGEIVSEHQVQLGTQGLTTCRACGQVGIRPHVQVVRDIVADGL